MPFGNVCVYIIIVHVTEFVPSRSGPCQGHTLRRWNEGRCRSLCVIETSTLNVYSTHDYAWLEFANRVVQLNRRRQRLM